MCTNFAGEKIDFYPHTEVFTFANHDPAEEPGTLLLASCWSGTRMEYPMRALVWHGKEDIR